MRSVFHVGDRLGLATVNLHKYNPHIGLLWCYGQPEIQENIGIIRVIMSGLNDFVGSEYCLWFRVYIHRLGPNGFADQTYDWVNTGKRRIESALWLLISVNSVGRWHWNIQAKECRLCMYVHCMPMYSCSLKDSSKTKPSRKLTRKSTNSADSAVAGGWRSRLRQ